MYSNENIDILSRYLISKSFNVCRLLATFKAFDIMVLPSSIDQFLSTSLLIDDYIYCLYALGWSIVFSIFRTFIYVCLICSLLQLQDLNNFSDEKLESRLYVGNLDLRITEYVNASLPDSFPNLILHYRV